MSNDCSLPNLESGQFLNFVFIVFPKATHGAGSELDEGLLSEIRCLAASVRGTGGTSLTVQERIGVGSCGPVFCGRLDGVEVAVKLMLFGRSAEGAACGALAECQARLGVVCNSSLVHPNVVGVNAVITIMIISRGGGGKTPQILPNKCKLGIFPPL